MEALYKLAYDISCYYAFAAFFLSYGMEYNVPAYSFLVLFAACFLAVYAEKSNRFGQAVQMVAFALPMIPFLMESTIWGKLVLLLPWAYMVITVLRRGYTVTYYRFRKTYLTIFWIYVAVFGFFMAEDRIKGEVAMVVTGPFIVILLVSGIFLLQMLRFQAGAGDKKKLEKYQRRQLGVFIAAAIVLTAGKVVELLYVYIFYPLTKLVVNAGVAWLALIISKLDSPRKPPKEMGENGNAEEYAEQLQEAWEKVESLYGPIRARMQELSGEPKEPNWTPVYIGAAVLAAIVIFAVLFGSVKKKKKPAAIKDEREDCFEEVTLKQILKKRSLRPEIVIRYYYREFMNKSEKKNQKLEISDTTKEILTKYQVWNNATPEQATQAEEATALYQKTRYSNSKMTHTDAKRMKALVKGL